MNHRIEVSTKPSLTDPIGEEIKKDIQYLGINRIENIRFIRVFILNAKTLGKAALNHIAQNILSDPVSDIYQLEHHIFFSTRSTSSPVEIAFLPGVMDPVALTTHKLLKKVGYEEIASVQTRNRYEIIGNISKREIEFIVKKLLMNSLIQVWLKDERKMYIRRRQSTLRKRTVKILKKSNSELIAISNNGFLSLNLEEMKHIQAYFALRKKNPTDIELETIAQTWSEHCVHKTFKGAITYNGMLIDNLLKSTIVKATEVINKDYCISVFKDNAGIIQFTKEYGITFKVETHNHPSALEPYGGAGTGIGGVIRDTLGTGLGAKPIANTDIFCFGLSHFPIKNLPSGVMHPKRIFKGVIAGVRDYGNRMGIPTVNGTIIFDNTYLYNPVVYCGSIGIIPLKYSHKSPKSDDTIVVCGGKTGKDGIHGVTFASKELSESSEASSSGAVQIGNPITEKKLLDALMEARDEELYHAITDCGGGGLSSAIGEMGQDLGVTVHLEKVPLKYAGLRYDEIWISESQERMIIAVPKNNLKRMEEIFKKHNVDYAAIGTFEKTGNLELFYKKKRVGILDMDFLHNKYPQPRKNACWKRKHFAEPVLQKNIDLEHIILRLLSCPTIASKEVVIRQYDHEVQGMSSLKPLVGTENDGPSDGAVLRPLTNSKRGIVITNGINPFYGKIDPYWMAAACIEEAMRNAVSCGGNPDKSAILDNFSWGDVSNPQILGELVRASQGCRDTAIALHVPFISGKDSLNNTFSLHGKKKSILSTLLISCISICDDVTKTISTDLKKAGNLIYLIGITKRELGASHYYKLYNRIGNSVPCLDLKRSRRTLKKVYRSLKRNVIKAIHDCSEGGLSITLAEMAIGGRLGMEIHLEKVISEGKLRNDELLFSESNSRFVVEIPPQKKELFEHLTDGVPYAHIGKVIKEGTLIINRKKRKLVKLSIEHIATTWKKGIAW